MRLLDITGKLIGVNNAMATRGAENIGFAIPVNTMRRVFHEVLLSSENLTSVYLGMQVREQDGRVVLSSVTEGSPAARSGLEVGDQLVEVQGKKVGSTLDYARSLLDVGTGQPISVVVKRDGRELRKQTVPMSNATWMVARRIGVELEVVTERDEGKTVTLASRMLAQELGQRYRGNWPGFLRVTRVRPRSPAATLGIKKGDVILGIVDRERNFFGSRNVLRHFSSVQELNDSLRSMSARRRNPEYPIWILRDGDVLDGPLEIPRL